jgi:acyl-CoA synthetase (AMP-forming)/AMP-acid ligase II
LVDRKKEIIIVDGANVYTSEVEVVLERHPAIKEAAVVGISCGIEGETVAAVVVLMSGACVDPGGIRDYLAGKLASFKLPSIVKIEAALPRTLVGKIDKKAVKQLAEKSAMDCHWKSRNQSTD